MARQNFSGNCVPRADLDQRARDARLSLVKIERSLVRRLPRGRFQLVRLSVWHLFREPKVARTEGSPGSSREGSIPEIDSAWLQGRGSFARNPACMPAQ